MRYLEDYKKLHENPKAFTGGSTYAFREYIRELVDETESESILDFGCGKARHILVDRYDLYWGVDVDLYEPAIEEFSQLKSDTYDGVICMSVLEHIPEEDLDEALEDIFSRARKFVLLIIDNYPSRNNKLLDGRGVHITLHDENWWRDRISKFMREDLILEVFVFSDKADHVSPPSRALRSR